MATKRGRLETPVERRMIPPLADLATRNELAFKWMDEDFRKLQLLCDAMEVPPGPYPDRFTTLALKLARKHCAGFKERAPRGKWNDLTRGYLVVEIERLTADRRRHAGHTASWAADQLAKRSEWHDFLGGSKVDPGEALRVQYEKFKASPWADVWRKAFMWHRHEDTLDEWAVGLLDALNRPHP